MGLLGKNPASIVLKRNTMTPGKLYRLELEVEVKGMKNKGFSSLDLLANIPPRGGTCDINPKEGKFYLVRLEKEPFCVTS